MTPTDVGESPGDPPRALDPVPARSDAEVLIDVLLGVAGESVGTGLVLLRRITPQRVLRSRAVWRPIFLPARLQPATLVPEAARRGARHRARAIQRLGLLLDGWTPALVELLVARLDLTRLVLQHLDIDGVVAAVDLDAAVARVDLDAVVARVDLDAAVARVDLDGVVARVDLDAAVERVDPDIVLRRVDLVALVDEVMSVIDLPAIIRDSSGSVASETVRGARMTGVTVDDAIGRALDGHLFRRRHPPPVTGG